MSVNYGLHKCASSRSSISKFHTQKKNPKLVTQREPEADQCILFFKVLNREVSDLGA
jgi:hypothetical protein